MTYLTLLLHEGVSALAVKAYLKEFSARVVPVSMSARRQIWSLDSDLAIEYIEDVIIENLPLEWSVTNAFVSDRKGEEL